MRKLLYLRSKMTLPAHNTKLNLSINLTGRYAAYIVETYRKGTPTKQPPRGSQ